MTEEGRNVRRRLNEANSVLSSLSEELSVMEVSQMCSRCVTHHRQDTEDIPVSPGYPHSVLQAFLDRQIVCLIQWGKDDMQAFSNLSQKRREKWSAYPAQEKWMYYATELLNEGIRWSSDTNASSFVSNAGTLPLATSNHGHVTCLAILAQRWNSIAAVEGLEAIEIVIFASLELWWFGYKHRVDDEPVTVHMTFDETETGGRLVVNRLERSEEVNDFDSIVFHNTLLGGVDSGRGDLSELDIDRLSYLLVVELVQELLQEQKRHSDSGVSEGYTVTALTTDLWHCVQYLHSFHSIPALKSLYMSTVGCVLRTGLQPPPGLTIPLDSALAAFTAALRLNENNYLVRRQLIECYLDIGEQYLAHQHCLHLLEQLAPGECVEAPIAVVTHDFAAELLDTTLQDVHQLHLRGEEGYERLVTIPGVGSRVEVEWLLDDQLVLYPGVVAVHPDKRSLCVSYADDVEPGQHRRRFENALHLVNINDPLDQYLENYFLTDGAQDTVEAAEDE